MGYFNDGVVVPPGVIDEIIKVLHDESTSLKSGELPEVSDEAFGGRTSAEKLAHHSRLAHQHLLNSLAEAVAGLQGTEYAVKKFDTALQGVDADAHAATTTLLHRTQHAVDQMDDNRYTPPAVPTTGSKP